MISVAFKTLRLKQCQSMISVALQPVSLCPSKTKICKTWLICFHSLPNLSSSSSSAKDSSLNFSSLNSNNSSLHSPNIWNISRLSRCHSSQLLLPLNSTKAGPHPTMISERSSKHLPSRNPSANPKATITMAWSTFQQSSPLAASRHSTWWAASRPNKNNNRSRVEIKGSNAYINSSALEKDLGPKKEGADVLIKKGQTVREAF